MPLDSPQQPEPFNMVFTQMIIDAANREANLRLQLISAQAQIASLQEAAAAPAAETPSGAA